MTITEKKRGAERTQRAVRDEWWTDERILDFLNLDSSHNENPDFHVLNKAYQGMVPESFSRFIAFFVEAGRDLNSTNTHGQTLAQILAQHRNSSEYLQILKSGGAG